MPAKALQDHDIDTLTLAIARHDLLWHGGFKFFNFLLHGHTKEVARQDPPSGRYIDTLTLAIVRQDPPWCRDFSVFYSMITQKIESSGLFLFPKIVGSDVGSDFALTPTWMSHVVDDDDDHTTS